MTGHVRCRNAVPPDMLDRDPGAVLHWFETDFDMGVLAGGETGLAPPESQANARLPGRDPADLKLLAVSEYLHETAALPALKGYAPRVTRGELEQGIGAPPNTNLLGECLEDSRRRRGHAHGNDDTGRQSPFPSTCDFKAESWLLHISSVSCNQRSKRPIAPALSA